MGGPRVLSPIGSIAKWYEIIGLVVPDVWISHSQQGPYALKTSGKWPLQLGSKVQLNVGACKSQLSDMYTFVLEDQQFHLQE